MKALSLFTEQDYPENSTKLLQVTNNYFHVIVYCKKPKMPVILHLSHNYRVTDTLAEVNLQDLMNHTAKRLLIYLEEVY